MSHRCRGVRLAALPAAGRPPAARTLSERAVGCVRLTVRRVDATGPAVAPNAPPQESCAASQPVTAQVPASTKGPAALESAATVTPKRLVASVGPVGVAGSPILLVLIAATLTATASYTQRLPDVACGFA